MATLIRFSDPPPTTGGDFERDCAEALVRVVSAVAGKHGATSINAAHGGVPV